MRSTLKTKQAAVTVTAGQQPAAPGRITLSIERAGEVLAVSLSPEEAAMLAGEIERAAWRAQRDAAALLVAA